MTTQPTFSTELEAVKAMLANKPSVKLAYLFGSYAYGHPDADSDLDICVVLDLEGRRKLDWMREIRRELSKTVSFPLDILVYDQKEFNNIAKLASTLEHKIRHEGILIYEQQRRSKSVAAVR
ncbi:MAG: nucleotidyltransferase domain-containing protein [Saprospiraceae bacterium]|nr:nucleotidyltransferase domain-containing protein [Saprospiraceae bacterium]